MRHLIAFAFIIVHNLHGDEVAVNTDQITSITHPHDSEGKKLLTERVQCAIGLSNAKFVSVIETCDEVLRKIEGVQP